MLDKLTAGLADVFAKLSFGGKLGSIIITIAIVLWVDSQMGFTYHYFTERKIGEIERLNEVLRDQSLDSLTRSSINAQRMEVISKSRGVDTDLPFHISYSWLMILLIIFAYQLLRNGSPTTTPEDARKQAVAVAVILILEIIPLYFIAKFVARYFEGYTLYAINFGLQLIFLLITFYWANVSEKRKLKKLIDKHFNGDD